MDRIDTPGSVGGEFRFGNPFALPPILSTIVGAQWLNGIQEEDLYVIEQAGLTADKADNTQLRQAIILEIQKAITEGNGLEDTFASAPGNGAAGDGVLIVDTFGVALAAFTTGNPVTIALSGQHPLPKTTGAGEGFAQGGAVYWDDALGECTNSSAAVVHLIGYAHLAATDGAATVEVRLNGTQRDAV